MGTQGFRLRDATMADQGHITALVLRHRLNPIDLYWARFVVAEDRHGNFVGCGQVRQHGTVHEIASLAVVPERQGEDLSRLLMEALLSRASRPTWLMCESPLITFYARYGFEEVTDPARMPTYFRFHYVATRPFLNAALMLQGSHVAFMAKTA